MQALRARLVLAAASFGLALTASTAHGDAEIFSPLDQRVIEKTTLVPAEESVTAYTAPHDTRVLLTRFCGGDCVRCEGTTVGSKVFGNGNQNCVEHPNGFELPPGETVRCTNTCDTMKAALFSGLLEP